MFALWFFTVIGCASIQAEEKWVDLFDGKTLNGWTINPVGRGGEAKVVDSEIHLIGNRKFFLCSGKKYSDFIFEAEVKLPEGQANSGFMFRCHVEPNKVFGYQAEIDGSKRAWSGGLFDEARRRWLYPQNPEGSPSSIEFLERSKGSFKRDDWNKCRIQAEGSRLRIWMNGVLCTDFVDDLDAEGYIALQHHGEKGQVYRFRNIRITETPKTAMTPETRKSTQLSYNEPAREWTDALPVGNGSMGAMVFGGVAKERIQFNHDTLWAAGPRSYSHKGASQYLPQLRSLLFEGKQKEAEQLAMEQFMSVPLAQANYQPCGDLILEFPGLGEATKYRRTLDLDAAVAATAFSADGVTVSRTVIASHPDGVIAVRLASDQPGKVSFKATLTTPHKGKPTLGKLDDRTLRLSGMVDDRTLRSGMVEKGQVRFEARVQVAPQGGTAIVTDDGIEVKNADSAVLYLVAATTYK